MLSDRERLALHRGEPHLLRLHRALTRLTSTLTVMNTGAHPDDEQSGMLAALRFAFGMRVVIACSTRGEGGQNSLGPERGAALGVLRTREMEKAARTIDADLVWLGHGPDDPVHDFGFSKNGTDTLARWGRERIIERLVRAYRSERPDIVIPTFLDVPGQHGHHRAMTEAAELAIDLAADPAYPSHGLDPWAVAKFYLPAWSGGGGTYDDEVPPPHASVHVRVPERDAATGAAFGEIGEWSRASHASQGMGHWTPVFPTEWPLHLRRGPEGAESDISAHLPATLGRLAERLPGSPGAALVAAQGAIESALVAFPRRQPMLEALVEAAVRIEAALPVTPSAERHRLVRKLAELDAALLLADGVRAFAWAEPNRIAPGGSATLTIQVQSSGDSAALVPAPIARTGIVVEPQGAGCDLFRFAISASENAELSSPYPAAFSSLGGNGELAVELQAVVQGRPVRARIDLDEAFSIGPALAAELSPEALILRRSAVPETVEIKAIPALAGLVLDTPPSWRGRANPMGYALAIPATLPAGRFKLTASAKGRPVFRETEILYPHIGCAHYSRPLVLDVLALDLELPANARIGYVGSGSDRVGLWLRRMGLDVTDLDAEDLAGDLDGYTTIVAGIFAFGRRPDLVAARPKLHAWVEAGGHLVTLYHRPSDDWNPEETPLRRLVIGSPSLRWRVTNPAADVTVLFPDHNLLARPNRITAADWLDWDKERGLYFASEWDPAYQALLAMSDAGEKALSGSLLSAAIGRGRHTHTSLALHHQLDKLVAGAFRLTANLMQPAWLA